jgi:hypothetical protein
MNPFDDSLHNHDWQDLKVPQKIFVEVEDDVICIRKQDNKLYIGKSPEEIEAARDVLKWVKFSGLQPAEVDQAIDELERARKMEEGR